MKKILLLSVTLAIYGTSLLAQTPTMHVKLKNGSTADFALSDIQKITFQISGQFTGADKQAGLIRAFALFQNYPNPFNPTTTIKYEVPRAGRVQTSIFSVTGQFVRDITLDASRPGVFQVTWDGRNNNGELVASGIYFYRVKFEQSVLTQKMMLLK